MENFSTAGILSMARRPVDQMKSKSKTHQEICTETEQKYQETEKFLEQLRAKKKLIKEQIENLERKQQNRQKFLKNSTQKPTED